MDLKVFLLGRVMVEAADVVVEASSLPGRQGRLAFVRLASAPRRIARDQLAEVLWDELPEAWETSLASIISKLRKVLGTAGFPADAIDGSDGSYELRMPPGTWVDLRVAINALDRAEGSLRRGEPKAAWADATVASAIFRRRFLAGEHGEWVERMRREVHEYELRTFDVIARVWLALDDANAALPAAQHVIDLAPYRESGHVRVMECHLAAGNRAEAIQSYNRLRSMLTETMGINPGLEAEALYERALG